MGAPDPVLNPALNAAFAALADPTRRAIVLELTRGERTATDLGRPFALSQPAISHHLKVLEGARLIHRRSEGTKRFFRLEAERLSELETWLEELRAALETNYARLDALLLTLCESTSSESERKPTDATRTQNSRRHSGHRHAPVRRASRGRLPRTRRT